MNYRLKTMEEMDACVFSSDMLYNDEERKHFKAMVARWARALNETENVAPPQREWQGLTEAEHTQIAIDCGCASADWVFYGAAVERKLKEKNT